MTAPSALLSRFNRPFDALLQLQDDAAAVSSAGINLGTVATVATIRDLGDAWTGIALAVIDINAADVVTGDETYLLKIQGSQSATFANTIVTLAMTQIGGATGQPTQVGIESVVSSFANSKRLILPFHNEKYGGVYRYIRFASHLSGTTPSLDAECYVTKLP